MVASTSQVARPRFLGPVLVGTVTLIAVVLGASSGIGFAFGYTIAKLLVSLALALPPFILWRYFTERGRARPAWSAVNVCCYLTVTMFLALTALLVYVPNAVSSLLRQGNAADVNPWDRDWSKSEQPVQLPSCKDKFGSFEDMVPKEQKDGVCTP